MRKALFLAGLIGSSALLSGCALFVVGAAAGAAGYVLSEDGIDGYINYSKEEVFQAVQSSVGEHGGIVVYANSILGMLKARIDGADVNVKIEAVTSQKARLQITARKNVIPQVDLAQKIYIDTLKKLGN